MTSAKIYKAQSYFHQKANSKWFFTFLNKFQFTLIYLMSIIILLVNISSLDLTVNTALAEEQLHYNNQAFSMLIADKDYFDFYEDKVDAKYYNTMKEVRKREIKALLKKGNVIRMTVTAYNSEVGQCDSTPCITADGFNVCEHNQEDVIATNILPFGTKVMFPELFGDKIFTVHDRMNKKYSYRADIWMRNKKDALKFGVHYNVKMVIVK